MNSYAFFTDSDSDLPFRFVDELELNMVYMPYMVDGKEYFDDLGRNGREKEFFDAMRKGAAPVTSLLPTAAYEEYFEPVFAAGRDILFVAFSVRHHSEYLRRPGGASAALSRAPHDCGGHAEHFAATEHSGAEGT